MKKTIFLSFLLSFILVSSQVGSAQGILNKLGKKVTDKIEKKTEEKIDHKVDEEVDKKLDNVFEGDSAKLKTSTEEKQQERMTKMMKGLGMSGDPVPISDSYSFDSKIQMHVESYKSNGDKENDGDFITYISPLMKNFAYEFISGNIENKGKGTIIMDIDNKAMIMLSDENGKKSGIVYGFDVNDMSGLYNEPYPDINDKSSENINLSPYLSKTGRTKTIEGYKCDEYKYDNPEEDTEAYFWLSKDVDLTTRDLMNTIFKSAAYSHGMPWGFIMESEAINKKTNERNLMKVTDIDTKSNKKFDLSIYQITNLGSIKIPDTNEK